jgi:hypothetical protein
MPQPCAARGIWQHGDLNRVLGLSVGNLHMSLIYHTCCKFDITHGGNATGAIVSYVCSWEHKYPCAVSADVKLLFMPCQHETFVH